MAGTVDSAAEQEAQHPVCTTRRYPLGLEMERLFEALHKTVSRPTYVFVCNQTISLKAIRRTIKLKKIFGLLRKYLRCYVECFKMICGKLSNVVIQ